MPGHATWGDLTNLEAASKIRTSSGGAADEGWATMSEHSYLSQLQMIWPQGRLATPPTPHLAAGYALRTYRPGDEVRFVAVLRLAGWPEWGDDLLRAWVPRILPDGWFMAVHKASGEIAATALAVHSHAPDHPFGGELGWVGADPSHTGHGLGKALAAAVTARLLRGGYRRIHLYTEDFRLPALRSYLSLGYVPFLYAPDMATRWQAVCEGVGWPFTPGTWRVENDAYLAMPP